MKQLIAVLILILAFSCSIFAAGCTGDPDIQLTAENAGERVELQTGQVLAITLASNPTTGYSWHVAEGNESVLRLQGDPEFQSESDLVGAGGVEVLRFEAVAAGEAALTLTYDRPWETDVEPLEVFTIHVVIAE